MDPVTARPRFNEAKAAQAAGVLLRTHPAKRFEYMRLIKLLYVSVRECLQERRHLMLVDSLVAMKHGPVMSRVYDLIRDKDPLSPAWSAHFRTDGYDIELVDNPGIGLLSRYEIGKLQEVAERCRQMDVWTLSESTHQFAEWERAWAARNGKKAARFDWQLVADAVQIPIEHMSEILQDAAFQSADVDSSEPNGQDATA